MKRPKESGLLAKYLIEDNDDDTKNFNINSSNNTEIVCSIFKTLMGDYQVYNDMKNHVVKARLKTVSEANSRSLNCRRLSSWTPSTVSFLRTAESALLLNSSG